MNIGVLGSGIVGQTVGGKLAGLGHSVVLGPRDPARVDEKKGSAPSLGEWLAGARVPSTTLWPNPASLPPTV